MQPLLFDEGWKPVVEALRAAGWPANGVGDGEAPPIGSSDLANCEWCRDHGAVLVTHDRGKKDRTILTHLSSNRVHAIFLHDDLRAAKTHEVVRAVLNSEGKMDQIAAGRRLLSHRLTPSGRLDKR